MAKRKKKTDTSLFRVGKDGPLQRSMPKGRVRTVDPSAVSRNERGAKQSRARAHDSSLTNSQRLSAAESQVSHMMGAAEGRGRAKMNPMPEKTVENTVKDRARRDKSVNQSWTPPEKGGQPKRIKTKNPPGGSQTPGEKKKRKKKK